MAMLMTICLSVHAEAAVPFTKEACIDQLTIDPSGPRLDPSNVRIGTFVSIEGWDYQIYSGMWLEDVCSLAVRRSAELASKDRKIDEFAAKAAAAERAGADNATFRRNLEMDIVRKNPYEMMFLVSIATAIVTILIGLFFKLVWRGITFACSYIFSSRERQSKHGPRILSEGSRVREAPSSSHLPR